MRSVIDGVQVNRTYIYRAGRVKDLAEKFYGRRMPLLTDALAGDIFYVFYLPFPRIDESVVGGGVELLRLAIVSELLSQGRTWKVKAVTVADASMSMVAATIFSVELLSRLRTGGRRGLPSSRTQDGDSHNSRVRRAVAAALSETEKAVRNVSSLRSIVAKTGAGTASSLSFEDSMDIVLELAKKTDITEIARILDRIKVSRLSSSRPIVAPKGWIAGFEIGGSLERIHPSRLALPEDLFLAELANSRLLLYRKELDSEEGPVYVLLDKSGSMSGHKINWARAVALALLIKSRSSGRRFYVRFFDSIVYGLKTASRRSRSREIMELVKYLATVRASGGTNITAAVAKAVEDIKKREVRGVGDIVLITDGEDKLSTHIMSSILGSANVNLHSVMISGHNPTLRSISTSYMSVERLDEDDALKVVKLVFK